MSLPYQGRFVLTVAVLALGASACGNVTEGSGSSGDAPPPGIAKNSIKLGTTLPLTGTAGLAGQGLVAGLRIAADEINAAGGVGGRKIELDALDDAYQPDRTVANVRRLVSQDKVYALIAPAGSQALPGTWQFIKSSRTPVWGPVSPADPKINEVYLLGATRTTQDRLALDYFADKGARKIAYIGQDNDLGAEGKAALDQQVPKHPGMKVVARATTQPGSTDVASAVNNVIAGKPDALLVAVDNNQVALILKQLRGRGIKIPVAADQGAAGAGSKNAVGPAGSAGEGLVSGFQVDVVSTDNPAVEHWRELAGKYGGKEGLSGFSLQTYSYLHALVKLFEKMGGDYSYQNFQKTAEGLKAAPIKLGMAPQIECGPLPDGHTCVRQAGLAEYRGGKWRVIKPFSAPQ
jgi:branched-chain amino acid transport system substrate-binding protein